MDNGIVTLVVSLINMTGGILVALIGRNKLAKIGEDAAEAKLQTKNSHNTNLRDDVDLISESVGRITGTVESIKSGQEVLTKSVGQLRGELRGIHRDVNGLRDDDGDIRRSLRIAVEERRRQFAELRADLPELIRRHNTAENQNKN